MGGLRGGASAQEPGGPADVPGLNVRRDVQGRPRRVPTLLHAEPQRALLRRPPVRRRRPCHCCPPQISAIVELESKDAIISANSTII